MRLSPALVLLPLLLAGCGVKPAFPVAPEGSPPRRTYPDPALDPGPTAATRVPSPATAPSPAAAATPPATVPDGTDLAKPVDVPESRPGLPPGTATSNPGP